MTHGLRRQIVTITGAIVLALMVAGVAQAAKLAGASQRRAMLQTSGIGQLNGAPAGFVKWAVVSTEGPYAVVTVVGRGRYRGQFQDALIMLHRTGARWHSLAVFEDESCPSVPANVFADLRHWFLRSGERVMSRGRAVAVAGLLSPRHPCV
jgi:hypothetical protein